MPRGGLRGAVHDKPGGTIIGQVVGDVLFDHHHRRLGEPPPAKPDDESFQWPYSREYWR